MADSHPGEELIRMYASGEDLPEEVVRTIEEHLDSCPECQETYFECLEESFPEFRTYC